MHVEWVCRYGFRECAHKVLARVRVECACRVRAFKGSCRVCSDRIHVCVYADIMLDVRQTELGQIGALEIYNGQCRNDLCRRV